MNYYSLKLRCRFIPVLTFIFLAGRLLAQDNYADSLRQIIANQKDDRKKLDNIASLARSFDGVDNDSLKKYADYLYQEADRIENIPLMAQGEIFRGKYYALQNEFDKSLFHYLAAYHLADSVQDTIRIAKAAINAGGSLNKLARDSEARDYYKISLKNFSALHDSAGIVACYSNLGMSFSEASVFDSAAYYLNLGLVISENSHKKFYRGNLLFNLGEVCKELGEYDKAMTYALKSIEEYSVSGYQKGIALAYNTLGNIYQSRQEYEEGIAYYKKAEEILLEIGDSLYLNHIYNNYGVLYQDQKNYPVAIDYFNKALRGYRKLGYVRGIIYVLGNQGTILSEQGKLREANKIQDSVVYLANKYGYPKSRKDALYNIYLNLYDLGEYKAAIDYQTRYSKLNDSIFNLDKEELIKNLMFKYEKEKDQAQILLLEKQNLEKDLQLKKRTIQRNAFLFTVIIVFALAIFLVLYFYQRRVKDRIIAEQKIRQLEEEKKLLAARSIVEGQEEERKRIAQELHDGLGVLLSATKLQFTSIRDSSPENKSLIDRATQLLEQASGDVRKISHNMMPGLLMKLGLYEAVEDLIEHINDTHDFQAQCIIPEDLKRLPENQEIMVYRIIQEMVNNTIKHAEAKHISLSITPAENQLEILFSDDGTGFDVDKMSEKGSLGLKSIKSRVDFLNGTLRIDSVAGKGTSYMIRIPTVN